MIWPAIALLFAICILPRALAQGPLPVATISGANFRNVVAPDSIVASFGSQLATGLKVAETVPLPTQLLGTVVTVTDSTGIGYVAPLLFVSPGQINYIMPAQLTAGTGIVSVRSGGGQTSTGPVQIAAVSPAIFTANQNGVGVPAADVLRVLSNGQQQTESPFTPGPDQTFIPKAINLGPTGERVFLILYLTGLRNAPNTDGNAANGSAENVNVLLGGVLQRPLYAGPQGSFAGLDQINLEIPRTLLDASIAGSKLLEISVKVDGFSDSNPVEIALAPPTGGTPLIITGVTAPTKILVNSVIQLTGTGIAALTEKNKVSFGEGSGDPRPGEIKTASSTQLGAVVPFGAQSGSIAVNSDGKRWTSELPVTIRTSFSAVLKDTEGQLLPPIVGARVCFPDCTTQGALTTTLQPGGWFVLPDTPPGARRVFVVEPVGQSAQLPFNRTLISSQILADRDNHLPQDIFVQAIYGPSGTVGTGGSFSSTSMASVSVAAPALDLLIEGFRLSVPAGAAATFPDGAKTGVLTLTPVKNSLTPVPLPASVFSTAIVQVSPFGVKLTPGGKLTFPNRDNLPVTPQPTLYKYDLSSAAFVDTGFKGTISSDGKSIETPAGSIIEASIYFVGLPQQTTTIVGRVVDSDGVTPVRGAVVLAEGRQVTTDGNGGFSVKDVSIDDLLSGPAASSEPGSNSPRLSVPQSGISVSASYLRPSGRTDTASGETTSIVVGGITNVPTLKLTAANSNQPPTILVSGYASLYATETRNVPVLVIDPDPGQAITGLNVTGAAFVSTINNGGGAFTLRLTPGASHVGSYTLSLTAADAAGATANVEMSVVVLPLPTADALSIVTSEDTSKAFVLTGSDSGGAPLSFSLITQPTHGTLSGTPPGLTYTPTPNFNGNDA
ncbi:MAG: Ig-like domain-containing protein, partial [Acidobacteriota bacterium]